MRTGTVQRDTSETAIRVAVNLDGTGAYRVSTGIGFFDHMLEQLSRHSLIDLEVETKGDLHIDQHHTVEDTGLAIGEAVAQALGDKRGIRRYADVLSPMDETLTRVALDISGRPFLVWKTAFSQKRLGEMDTEMFEHFFHSFAQTAGDHAAHRDAVRQQQSPHRRGGVQGAGACAARGDRDRSAQGGGGSEHQGRFVSGFALIDCGAGNLQSVANAFRAIGVEPMVTADPDVVAQADRIVLPGVGAFAHCMGALSRAIRRHDRGDGARGAGAWCAVPRDLRGDAVAGG